jgi:hypothetical protein
MRVLCCGTRTFDDHAVVMRAVARGAVDEVCHGGALGADTLAGQCAEELGKPVAVFNADWGRYGKRAGPIRNTQMLDEFDPEVVFAFVDDASSSAGTANMVLQALARQLPVHLFNLLGDEFYLDAQVINKPAAGFARPMR